MVIDFINRFHRGQPVYVEGKDLARFAAHISAIGTEAVSTQVYERIFEDKFCTQHVIWLVLFPDLGEESFGL